VSLELSLNAYYYHSWNIFVLSTPADFVEDIPDLTNLDTSSAFVISLSKSLVILDSVFGFNTFPVSADIPVVYEIISSIFVVPLAISAAVIHHLDLLFLWLCLL
jgi:hypothetical protein